MLTPANPGDGTTIIRGDDFVRGCCWGAARLLADVGVEVDANVEVERVYQERRHEITERGAVDYVGLAALVLLDSVDSPRLF